MSMNVGQSTEVYLALKILGVSSEKSESMCRAREFVLSAG